MPGDGENAVGEHIKLSLMAGISVLSAATANAQTVNSSETARTEIGSSKGSISAEEITTEDVVVTGSRVITDGNNSPTPITVLNISNLQATHPTTVFQSLLDVPAFAGSRGGFSSNPGGNNPNNNQVSALNLRGLGPVRTLILFDGHRVPATEPDGLVDANTIPQMLLQRVDVVTGGASAVYGSDAVGGVVNFVTDKTFKGLKVDIQQGISQYGDAATYQAGVAYGADLFGGRGHFETSYQRLHNDGILHRNARDQFNANWTVQGNGCPGGAGSANCVPFFLAANALNSSYSYGGKITGPAANPLLNYTFASNGVLQKFVNGSSTGLPAGTTIQFGGDGIADTSATLIPSQTLDQVFGRFDFDVTDNIHYFASVSATKDQEFHYYGNVNSQNLTISAQNAFLPAAYQQQLAAAGISTFTFSKKYGPESLMPPSNVNDTTQNLYINTGFNGNLGKFKWEASYTHASTRLETWANSTFDNGRFFAAVDAVKDSSGAIVCRVTLTNPGLYPGCVPINLFGPSSESQAAIDYTRREGEFLTSLAMDSGSGSISGAPFALWAGPVNVALSGEWRRQSLSLTSQNPTIDFAPLNCTGLLYNCSAANASSLGTPAYNGGVAPRTPVSMTVVEGAIEADVPVLKDFVIAQAVNLNLAYRYAKYVATGSPDLSATPSKDRFTAQTWKIGVDWRVNDRITFRGTRSQDIRAPNLYELYNTNSITFTNSFTDFLTNQNLTGAGNLVQVQAGGNPQLRPETAETATLGVVFKPTPSLSFAVDAYKIDVRDYIATLAGYTASVQNGCYAGNAFDCSLQQRPGSLTDTSKANAVTRWLTVPANASTLSTKGIDFEVNYGTRVFARPFSVRGLLSYQPHIYYNLPGQVQQDYAGALGVPATFAAVAQTRASVSLHYKVTDHFTIDWQTTWREGLHQSPDPTLNSAASADAPAVSFSNLTLSFDLNAPGSGAATLYLNVTNVFNTQAPIAANYTFAGSPGIQGGFVPGDDPTGRYFRVGLRAKW